ncbi:MAG: alpha/beta hydrolase [Saprospiraceae bacterium]|nr:alpha/beta hydrolase [Saprospiraceae bacterium]
MSNPQIRKLRDHEEEVLDRSIKETIRFKKFDIQTYTWGNPDGKMVFLIHGWEGQAGNFAALIDILIDKGYYIKAFDAPSHGHSSIGKTSMFEFAELVTQLIEQFKPAIIVSHSFGSVTSLMAMSKNPDIPIEKWIVVTTPHNFKDKINDVKHFLGLSDKVIAKVKTLVEENTDLSIDEMNMTYFADKIGHIDEAIMIHSRKDKILPIDYARKANQAIKQSTLIELDNHGHYSILWSDELQEIIRNELN